MNIDLTAFSDLGIVNPLFISWWIFIKGGWIALAALFIVGLYIVKLESSRMKYRRSIDYILLAIDVPKENEQSLKAVEQIFAQLAAVESKGNLYERYWQGKVQDTFSLELVSIEGYIQFIIRTPTKHRDLVEASIYAQYPDAEVTEVDDYTTTVPDFYPDKDFDLYGTELTMARPSAYPIRTYLNFEHTLTQTFADPMASILEALSRLLPGEQVWLQLVLTPIDSKWVKNATYRVKKLIGEKIAKKGNILSPLGEAARGFGDEALSQLAGGGIAASENSQKKDLPSKMQFLSPGDRNIVEAIQDKISKIGFKTKIRMIYSARKEVFDKNRGVNPIMGAILQYNTYNLNAFKSHKKTKTKVNYVRVKKRLAYRQRKIIRAYKRRANYLGIGEGFILNIEELASIYHFPISTITAPLVQKTEIRKAGPPSTLPRQTMIGRPMPSGKRMEAVKEAPLSLKAQAPENLPTASEIKDE